MDSAVPMGHTVLQYERPLKSAGILTAINTSKAIATDVMETPVIATNATRFSGSSGMPDAAMKLFICPQSGCSADRHILCHILSGSISMGMKLMPTAMHTIATIITVTRVRLAGNV